MPQFPARRSSERRVARSASFGLVAALVLGAALAGCSSAAKTPKVLFVTPSPTHTPAPTPTPVVTPSPTPTPPPTPKPSPTTGPCFGANLKIAIAVQGGVAWQSGAGHEMASFTLTNTGSAPCLVKSKSQPMLLNGDKSVLITGPVPGSVPMLMLAPSATLRAQVQTSNLCAAPPIVAPVTVGFVIAGTGLVVSDAASPTDLGGVPSCMGDANVPSGDIQMTSWAP
jgi:hypothetical protein